MVQKAEKGDVLKKKQKLILMIPTAFVAFVANFQADIRCSLASSLLWSSLEGAFIGSSRL